MIRAAEMVEAYNSHVPEDQRLPARARALKHGTARCFIVTWGPNNAFGPPLVTDLSPTFGREHDANIVVLDWVENGRVLRRKSLEISGVHLSKTANKSVWGEYEVDYEGLYFMRYSYLRSGVISARGARSLLRKHHRLAKLDTPLPLTPEIAAKLDIDFLERVGPAMLTATAQELTAIALHELRREKEVT